MIGHETRSTIGYIVVTLGILGVLVFAFQGLTRTTGDPNVDFCRDVLTGLAKGKSSVQAHIDWAHLSAMDVDIGTTYTRLRTPVDRARYEDAFVESFAKGFHKAGGRVSAFVNWRIHEHKGDTITVAADLPRYSKTLLMVMSATEKKQLEAIRWLGANGSSQDALRSESSLGKPPS